MEVAQIHSLVVTDRHFGGARLGYAKGDEPITTVSFNRTTITRASRICWFIVDRTIRVMEDTLSLHGHRLSEYFGCDKTFTEGRPLCVKDIMPQNLDSHRNRD